MNLAETLQALFDSWFKGKKDLLTGTNMKPNGIATYFKLDDKAEKQLNRLIARELERTQQENSPAVFIGTADDHLLVDAIRKETDNRNQDNCTRTASYLQFYQQHPEIHWALLAHMVSRNGGWAMTDLKGDPVGRLMNEEQRGEFFGFLERCNYLIFGDAYPQLLIWKHSVELKKPLFHMLPQFGVSRCMVGIWQWFWEKERQTDLSPDTLVNHRCLLTHALVINEQNFIEKRVVQNKVYQSTVLQTVKFQAQKWLDLTLVLFPYQLGRSDSFRAAGVIVHDFGSLAARIQNGKQLYEILFGIRKVYEGCLRWAIETPHTGSRHDYLPSLYRAASMNAPMNDCQTIRKFKQGCVLTADSLPFLSPSLREAWPAVKHQSVEREDWCKKSDDILDSLMITNDVVKQIHLARFNFDLTDNYCAGLKTMELAAEVGAAFT